MLSQIPRYEILKFYLSCQSGNDICCVIVGASGGVGWYGGCALERAVVGVKCWCEMLARRWRGVGEVLVRGWCGVGVGR